MNYIVPGCNYRCSFCPNKDLIHHHIPMIKHDVETLVKIIRPRLGFIEGVSLSGGEPLLHRKLGDFLREMRFQGIKVKIKTNASRPRDLKYLIDEDLVDYISVFIPAPFSKYLDIINYRQDIDDVKKGIQHVRRSSVPYEFTVKPVPGLVDLEDLEEIAVSLAGSRRLVVERYDPSHLSDPPQCATEGFSEGELLEMVEVVRPYFGEVALAI